MSVDTLVQALDGLQRDAARRQEYNGWLQEFQRSAAAWETCYAVLESDAHGRALKIFCAQTLRNKVAHDLHQVPRAARLHLKDQMLALLERNAALLNVVGVQLCIALAAFAMQVAEWAEPVQELMAKFDSAAMVPLLFEFLKVLPEEFTSSRVGMLDPALRAARATALVQNTVPLVLNFMLARADVMVQSGATQALFFEALRPWLNEIDLPQIIESPLVDWITAAVGGGHDEARAAAADCLIAVLRETSDVHEPHVQAAIHTLFPRVVALARQFEPVYADDPDAHRDCTRVLSEAARAWHVLLARDPQNFMPLLEAVAACVAVPHADLETVEFTCDFFDKLRTVLGEPLPGASGGRAVSAAAAAAATPREPFVPIFLQLFASFTRLLEFPASFNDNLEEEELFRDFRYDVGDMLKICSSIAGHREVLRWCYERLAQLVTDATAPPPADARDDARAASEHGGAPYRTDAGAIANFDLTAATKSAPAAPLHSAPTSPPPPPPPTIPSLAAATSSAARGAQGGSASARALEALLFAVRAIARTVPDNEDTWLPKLYGVLPRLPHGRDELVQHAAIMLLGRYSEWLAQHTEFLPFVLEYVVAAVWAPFHEVRRAAAHAFLYLCTDASKAMVSLLPQLLQFYQTLSGRVDLESLVKYSDGLGAIIKHLDGAELSHALAVVFAPVVERATQLCAAAAAAPAGAATLEPTAEEQVACDIQGIGSMIAMIEVPQILAAAATAEDSQQPQEAKGGAQQERLLAQDAASHPLVAAVRAHHALFTSMLVQFKESRAIVESIARYYIRILFNVGATLEPEVGSLLAASRSVAEVRPLTPVQFQLGSAVVQCYNPRQGSPHELADAVWQHCLVLCEPLFSDPTLQLLKTEGATVERLTTASAVVYHGFHLLCDITVYYPQAFFAHLFEPTLMLSVEVFNECWDSDALCAVSNFFDDIESFAPQIGRGGSAPLETPERARIADMIEKHGYAIVHALFFLFLVKPDAYFEPMAQRIIDFAFRLAPVASVTWLQQLLLSLPPGTVSDDEKIVFAQQVFQLASSSHRGIGQEMSEFVRAYAARNLSPR